MYVQRTLTYGGHAYQSRAVDQRLKVKREIGIRSVYALKNRGDDRREHRWAGSHGEKWEVGV